MTAGFTEEGLAAFDAALSRHVTSGEVPGFVALVARDGQVHVTHAGHKALGDSKRIERDAIFRIASLSKPIVGAAAMLLIEDGAMALTDPVEQWLPELANRRVLRTLESELGDTVPAERPITVADVLSFRFGFGSIMTPGSYPIAAAEGEIGLNTLGPPWPPTTLTPDEWIAGLGSLPLLDQPGTRWRYNTGATVTGILIERVTGVPLAQVLAKRVFEPLGMNDTGFFVPAGKRHRFTSLYQPGPAGLKLLDTPEGWYSAPPALPDAAAWLVSTIGDLEAFTAMLAADGGGLLSAESVRQMLKDRTSDRDKAENAIFFGDHSGWGLMMSVPASGTSSSGPGAAPEDGTPRGYGWDGGSGTMWRTDPATGLTGILLTQRMMTSPEPLAVTRDFWTAARAACA
ncbi:MAG TPA: serine hydrolase domain-containing protein [Trebonia sp.]|jgi:CubicO group peptidase (beta-lactamase class C family)|nr:serine hydrolase domain-containing protein [Trebonia sp.]